LGGARDFLEADARPEPEGTALAAEVEATASSVGFAPLEVAAVPLADDSLADVLLPPVT
jgi:hypothetical protein